MTLHWSRVIVSQISLCLCGIWQVLEYHMGSPYAVFVLACINIDLRLRSAHLLCVLPCQVGRCLADNFPITSFAVDLFLWRAV